MNKVDFFVCAFMHGLETAVQKAGKLGISDALVENWKGSLRSALSPT